MRYILPRRYIPVIFGGLIFSIPNISFAFIPLICDLCVIGVVAGLGISRQLGLDDSVVGVWIGACLVVLITMTNSFLEKRNWKFRFRDTIVAATYIIFMAISFKYFNVIGSVGMNPHTFFNATTIFADKIVVSSAVGALVLLGSTALYQWLKVKNNGKAHFPFEKVVLPIMMLSIASTIFHFITAR
ncbi:MAG: hypothetical protein PHU93_03680 [Candidatus Gracilibacteria bacterium]|nr:hypothetical protein [Candidatus Gracilibacteria bacterium]